jgi:hypothetical protein
MMFQAQIILARLSPKGDGLENYMLDPPMPTEELANRQADIEMRNKRYKAGEATWKVTRIPS